MNKEQEALRCMPLIDRVIAGLTLIRKYTTNIDVGNNTIYAGPIIDITLEDSAILDVMGWSEDEYGVWAKYIIPHVSM